MIDFNDLDQAQVLKSLINEMKESGKLDINSVIDQQEEIEKSWGIDNIREEAWSDPSLDDGSQIEKREKVIQLVQKRLIMVNNMLKLIKVGD